MLLIRPLIALIIVWLVLKDWVLSNAQNYPYAASIGTTLAIAASALASRHTRSCRFLPDILLVLATAMCVMALGFLMYSPQALLATMPGTGILACAFVFPFYNSSQSHHDSASIWLYRRMLGLRVLAGLVGIAALCAWCDLTFSHAIYGLAIAVPTMLLATIVSFSSCTTTKQTLGRCLILIVYGSCAVIFCALPLFALDTGYKWSLLGEGLSSGNPNLSLGFIQEQGIFSILLIDILVLLALCSNAWLLMRMQSESDESQYGSVALSSGAVASLLVLIICTSQTPCFLMTSCVIGTWVFTLSVASLFIANCRWRAGFITTHKRHRPNWHPFSYAALAAFAIFLLFITAGEGAMLSFSQAETPNFISLRRIPQAVQTAALLNAPVTSSWRDIHNIVRRSCGAEISVIPSMADLLGYEALGAKLRPNALANTISAAAGVFLSNRLSRDRILELYLNERDYGVPRTAYARGLVGSASYYFRSDITALTAPQLRFMMASQPFFNQPAFSFRHGGARTQFQPELAQRYKYRQLNIPFDDQQYAYHDADINEYGSVVGTVFASDGSEGLYWSSGKALALQGSGASFAIRANVQGETIGWIEGPQAALWDAYGHMRALGSLPGFQNSIARGINNLGDIVGYCYNASSGDENAASLSTLTRPFMWSAGRMYALDVPPGYTSAHADAINDYKQAAGWALTEDGRMHAVVWEDGVMHDIGTYPGGRVSIAVGINDAGQVVGSAQRKDGFVTAFLWQDGLMHDLGTLGKDNHARAWRINDLGQIVGLSFNYDLDGPGGKPFIWDCAHGMRPLIPMLQISEKMRRRLVLGSTVFSLNDHNQVVGLFYAQAKPIHRYLFVLTPIGVDGHQQADAPLAQARSGNAKSSKAGIVDCIALPKVRRRS